MTDNINRRETTNIIEREQDYAGRREPGNAGRRESDYAGRREPGNAGRREPGNAGRRDLPRGKRKRKKKGISGLPFIIILLFTLTLVVAGGSFFYINGNRLMLPGEWSREIDITDYVREAVKEYLASAAYGDEVDVASYIAEVKVESILTVSKDGRMSESISTDSYEQARLACRSGLEAAVKDLIGRRIESNYIETNMSVDELMNETFGVNLSDYLNSYGPELMPDMGVLEETYGRDNTFEAKRDSMIITYSDTDSAECSYAVAHGMLVIDYRDGAAVYYER